LVSFERASTRQNDDLCSPIWSAGTDIVWKACSSRLTNEFLLLRSRFGFRDAAELGGMLGAFTILSRVVVKASRLELEVELGWIRDRLLRILYSVVSMIVYIPKSFAGISIATVALTRVRRDSQVFCNDKTKRSEATGQHSLTLLISRCFF
jgi:hypothetical protein